MVRKVYKNEDQLQIVDALSEASLTTWNNNPSSLLETIQFNLYI